MPFVDLVADTFATAVGNVNVGRVRLGHVTCAGVVNGVLIGGALGPRLVHSTRGSQQRALGYFNRD